MLIIQLSVGTAHIAGHRHVVNEPPSVTISHSHPPTTSSFYSPLPVAKYDPPRCRSGPTITRHAPLPPGFLPAAKRVQIGLLLTCAQHVPLGMAEMTRKAYKAVLFSVSGGNHACCHIPLWENGIYLLPKGTYLYSYKTMLFLYRAG